MKQIFFKKSPERDSVATPSMNVGLSEWTDVLDSDQVDVVPFYLVVKHCEVEGCKKNFPYVYADVEELPDGLLKCTSGEGLMRDLYLTCSQAEIDWVWSVVDRDAA